jgi:ribulose-5-phosphate 4-epimerase/fuculose-1-phosphate aldolase
MSEGMHFSLIRDEDLIRVDENGKVIDGGKNRRLNYGEFCPSSLHVIGTIS